MKTNWQTKKLGELCEIRPLKSEVKFKLKDKDLVSFVPMEDLGIFCKNFDPKHERQLKDVSGSYTYFANEDVLLAKITPCFENGKIGIARDLKNGVGFGSSEFVVFRSRGQILSDYLYYILSSDNFRNRGIKLMSGAVGHKRVPKEYIKDYEILLPSLTEQKRIVKILDEVFEKLEKVKQNTEKNIENSKDLFESYMNSIFTNPKEDWEEKRFDEICVLQRGFDLPKRLRSRGKFPLVSSNGTTDRINLWKVKAPGVITGRSGTIGNVHFVEEDFWPLNTALYIKDFHGNDERFIFYFLKQFNLGKFSSGAGVPTLNRNNVHGETVWLPKLIGEQKSIVKKLDQLSEQTKKLESIYQNKLSTIDELKKSILQKAFSGKL